MLSIMDDTATADARCPDLAAVDDRLKTAARDIASTFLREYSLYDTCKESYANKTILPADFLDIFGKKTSDSPAWTSVVLYAFSAGFLASRIRYSNLPKSKLVVPQTLSLLETPLPAACFSIPAQVTSSRSAERWWPFYFWPFSS